MAGFTSGAGRAGPGTAQLQQVITALRYQGAPGQIDRQLMRQLQASQRPFAPKVRAAILNTPAYGPKHTGLRLRIAACVQTFVEIHPGGIVSAGIEVNAARMPSGQKSLPLYLDGRKAPWRHPLFGKPPWYSQASHPFFAQAVALYGPASQRAVQRAADAIVAAFDAQAG
jgi:hypothetical protein